MAQEKSVKLLIYLACLWLVSSLWKQSSAQDIRIPNVDHHNPVHIGAKDHVVQGHISVNAKPGELVPYNVVVEGHEDPDLRLHLRVEVRGSVYKRPYLYHPNTKINNSDPRKPQFEHPVEQFLNDSLPYGMQFVVIHSDLFDVNGERYITVKDLSSLQEQTRVHFDVILKDKLAEIKYVSNHLPFVVDVAFPIKGQNPDALLFAGVLVLAIVAISLIIPFAVRAKRRSKVGKPIFGCGSVEDVIEQESLGNSSADGVSDYPGNTANSVGGKDNLAMILENCYGGEDSITTHTSIQKRMLMSTSSIKFQPRWMDPHYNDVYNRPDFNKVKRKRSSKEPKATIHSRRPPIVRMTSTNNKRSNSSTVNDNFVDNKMDKINGKPTYPARGLANGVPASCGFTVPSNNGSCTAIGGIFTVGDKGVND